MKKIIVILLTFVSITLYSQNEKTFFQKDDRVCFVGNSITNQGEFHHNILLYQITRFPNMPLLFFNCGISGNKTENVLSRMEDDILLNKPTKAIIMIGMNDVSRSLYGPKPTTNADTLKLREDAISLYKTNLEKIVSIFLEHKIKVILQKPSIYDQTAVFSTPNGLGVNDALKRCADFMGELAAKYSLQTVDYWTIMTNLNQQLQKQNPSATLTSTDRVHPGPTGHFVMAYQFLKTENAPQYVAKMLVEKDEKSSNKSSLNANFQSVKWQKDNVEFTVKENSLPFPIVETQMKAVAMVPFVDELNVELLQVKGLKEGNYSLLIDEIKVGDFSQSEFQKGINLAKFEKTPQYQQALKVRSVLVDLWTFESKLRGLKFIEYNYFYRTAPNKSNIDSLKSYLTQKFETQYKGNSYFKQQLTTYFENKPKDKEYATQSDLLRTKAYELAQPVAHSYKLIRK
jgi:lysophospholipase L1-like esterase